MQHRRRRNTSLNTTTILKQLPLVLTVGSGLVALLRAIDPQWQDLLIPLVRWILTRPDH